LVIKVGLFCSAINIVYKPHNKDITIYNKGERRAKCQQAYNKLPSAVAFTPYNNVRNIYQL